jgi:GNAT superfamily N-acetyltransferase
VSPVRRAAPSDLDALLPLVAEFCAIDGHEYEPDRVVRALEPLLVGDDLGHVWVLDGGSGQPPAGYAVVTWGHSLEAGGREALLDEIYVRDRNEGAGALLLDAALDGAREAGAGRCFLETESANTAVRRFYGRHGFVVEDSVWMQRPL